MHGKRENLEPGKRLPYSLSDCIVLNNCHIYLAQFFQLDRSQSVASLPCEKKSFCAFWSIKKTNKKVHCYILMSHSPALDSTACIS